MPVSLHKSKFSWLHDLEKFMTPPTNANAPPGGLVPLQLLTPDAASPHPTPADLGVWETDVTSLTQSRVTEHL